MIVSAGEVMLWWAGDYFKAAIHRVSEPPAEQKGHNRSSVFYFCVPNDDVIINTLLEESSVLREAGVKMAHKPENAPRSKEWTNGRIKITGRNAVFEQNNGKMAWSGGQCHHQVVSLNPSTEGYWGEAAAKQVLELAREFVASYCITRKPSYSQILFFP
jgi:hypothetical protein